MTKDKNTKKELDFDTSKFSKHNIWLFNSADQFTGNVKYLFLYIYNFHKEIYCCYISENDSIVKYIRSLGYPACSFKTEEAGKLMRDAGVYVTENCKEYFPEELYNTKILNLFHGIGLKEIERKWSRDFLGIKIAKKYIRYNQIYRNNMCFLVTSDFMENHFKEQLDLTENQIIRAGYPRCINNADKIIETYNKDYIIGDAIRSGKKIAVYAPTYREKDHKNFLNKAIKDINRLIEALSKSNIFLIIKLHPKSVYDLYFKNLENASKNSSYILLWDNKLDIYEIFNKIDIAIIDYSSIYYDLAFYGIRHFIRYIFDFEEESNYLIYDYFENTTGKICRSFDSLINTIENNDFDDDDIKIKFLNDKFWSYSTNQDNEEIIKQARAFNPIVNNKLKNLYSFDIFDTLISRKVLKPAGIFYYVMEKIRNSNECFPDIFKYDYPHIRIDAENNVREFTKKCIGNFEIKFESIFDRILEVYHIDGKQVQLLKEWEIEAEIDNVIKIDSNIKIAEQLVDDGADVILISDMYLSKEIIIKLLSKVSSKLANLPIFISSEVGLQKTTQKLYLSVYRSFDKYIYHEWHHYGDNNFADFTTAQSIGIIPHLHDTPQFNDFEQNFIYQYKCYDAFLLSAILSRYRFYENLNNKEYYVFAHLGFCLVPYIIWSIRDALRKNINTLYFISRDGYFLKKIADTYISLKNIKLKTKYIFGSRRVWRLPAMIDSIDEEFYSNYGNFVGVDNYNKLLESLDISDHKFQTLFPELYIDKDAPITKKDLESIKSYFMNSDKFSEFILEKAKNKRKIVIEYLRQEINFSEKFAFVEFWGRGYTQTLFGRLLDIASDAQQENIFYYYRSILPTQNRNIRLNFTTNKSSLIFCEAIFANHPFHTVYDYKRRGEVISQVMDKKNFDTTLFQAMEIYLPKFVEEFVKCKFILNTETIERFCSDFSLYWFSVHQDDPCIVDSIAHLEDSVELWGDVREFAPAFNEYTLNLYKNGKQVSSLTKSLTMSLARSTKEIRDEFLLIKKSKNQSDADVEIASREDKLLLKLQKYPERFFRDSKISVLRILSKICFTPFTRRILGDPLISFARRQLLLRKLHKEISPHNHISKD